MFHISCIYQTMLMVFIHFNIKSPSPLCVYNGCVGPNSDSSNYCMIALSSSIGGIFHLILASRFQSFRLSYKLINPSLQKASIKSCSRHCSVSNSLFLHTHTHQKKKKKIPLHLVWMLLAVSPTDCFLILSLEMNSLKNSILYQISLL